MFEVIFEDDNWRAAIPDAEVLAAACYRMAAKFESKVEGEAALLLANDSTLQALNAKFRGLDKPTNVLSFPSEEGEFLGDIALAFEICELEAAEKNIAMRAHATHLIIHGILHLTGYDHETEEDAVVMGRREIEILNELGVANPYADPVEHV